MSVSGISSTSFCQPGAVQNSYQQRRAEFQQLGQALQSGDLSAAQQDFAELTQTSSGQTQGVPTAQSAQSAKSQMVAQEFNNLGQALGSGDLVRAQQAYSQMQQDVQGAQQTQGHHHHHHHHAVTQAAQSGTSDSSNSSGGSTSTGGSTNTAGSSSGGAATAISNLMSLFSAMA
jgi:hypothetical protein